MIKLKTVIPITSIEQATLNGAYKIFNIYKNDEIIKTGSFDNRKWMLCNDSANVGFNFEFNQRDYLKYQPLFKESYESFVKKVKIYVLYKMGLLALTTLQSYILALKKMIATPPDCISSIEEQQCISHSDKLLEFIEMFKKEDNVEEIDYLKSEIYDLCHIRNMRNRGSQRILAAYNSYLLFREKIEQFWSDSNDDDEKLFFFPVWMWWQITTIVPMRPIEFVLTPRKCLTLKNNDWHLKIRKSGIKGSKRKIKYKINEDYYFENVIITQEIANEINWYIEKTNCYAPTEIETLFVTDTHYKRWNWSKPYTSRYFTYINLHTCLNYFYEFILKDYYGLEIIEDKERSFLNSNEIQRISLGDTRHLSMIDAIQSGVLPSVVSVLSGHDSIGMSAYYFSNADKFVECETYRAHNKLIKQKNAFSHSKRIEQLSSVKIDTIDCNYNNCTNAIGPNGEIGYCSLCKFNPTSNELSDETAKKRKQAFKDDAKVLCKIADLYRKSKTDKEDFMIAYQKFLGSKNSYSEYLMEKKGNKPWEEKEKSK